jgi:adenylate cyclase
VSRRISFGRFEVQLDERLLLVDGQQATLGSRAFDVLIALLERRDRVVTKGELLDIAWPGLVVEENNLSVQISSLRKVLGAQTISTVAGRGYQFAMSQVNVLGMLPLQANRSAESSGIVRRICVIACADVVGWAALLATQPDAAIQAWRRARVELIEPSIIEFSGQVIELMAEKLLVEFSSAVDAVRWALELQARLARWRDETDPKAKAEARSVFHMRMSIGVEDLIVDDGKLFGAWFEAAQRLLQSAAADQVVVTAMVKQFAENRAPVQFRTVSAIHSNVAVSELNALYVIEPASKSQVASGHQLVSGLGRRPAVAVMPFSSEANEVEPYFGDGMTEEIITALSVNRSLFVIARSSTLRYRQSAASSSEIASELGVRYLVVGSLRRMAQQLRINAELIDASANRVIWAQRFDGVAEDVFGFQSQIAASISAAIDPRINEAEMARVAGRPTESLDAYDSVLRALSLIHTFRGADFETAGQLFRRAIEIDPAYAQAHAHLAWWHNLRFGEGRSPEINEDAREAARLSFRAIELDPRDATSLSIAGHVQSFIQRKAAVAIGMFDQALAIDPNCAIAWSFSATTLAYVGEAEESMSRVAQAMRLSPFDRLSFSFYTTNGTAAIVAGRYDEAASWLSKARRLNPGFRAASRLLIAALALSGERVEALELSKGFMASEPSFRVSIFGAWYPLCEPHLSHLLKGMRLGGLPE